MKEEKATPRPLPARLREIQERAEKATKGPWVAERYDGYKTDPPEYLVKYPSGDDVSVLGQPDAVFIAHAREDIPYLLSALTDLSARVEQAEKDKKETQQPEAEIECETCGTSHPMLQIGTPFGDLAGQDDVGFVFSIPCGGEWHIKIGKPAGQADSVVELDAEVLALKAQLAVAEARILDLEATLQRRDGQ